MSYAKFRRHCRETLVTRAMCQCAIHWPDVCGLLSSDSLLAVVTMRETVELCEIDVGFSTSNRVLRGQLISGEEAVLRPRIRDE